MGPHPGPDALRASISACPIATSDAEVLLGGFSAFLRALSFADTVERAALCTCSLSRNLGPSEALSA